jgi:hypothetical protein
MVYGLLAISGDAAKSFHVAVFIKAEILCLLEKFIFVHLIVSKKELSCVDIAQMLIPNVKRRGYIPEAIFALVFDVLAGFKVFDEI